MATHRDIIYLSILYFWWNVNERKELADFFIIIIRIYVIVLYSAFIYLTVTSQRTVLVWSGFSGRILVLFSNLDELACHVSYEYCLRWCVIFSALKCERVVPQTSLCIWTVRDGFIWFVCIVDSFEPLAKI